MSDTNHATLDELEAGLDGTRLALGSGELEVADPARGAILCDAMQRLALILAVVIAVFYGLTTIPDELIYDDGLLIGKQAAPRNPSDVGRVFTEPHYLDLPYYRPLVRSSYVLQKAVHGNDPGPYRIVNAMIAGLLFLALWRLLKAPVFAIDPNAALAAAAWLTLHPMTSSCVYPVAGRETLMAALWTVLAAGAWLKDGRWARIAAPVLFGAALLSKEQAVVIPGLFLLADLWLRRPRPRGREWIVRYAPVAAVLVAYFAIRGAVLKGGIALGTDPAGPLKSLVYGLQTTAVPSLDLVYEPPPDGWFSSMHLLGAIALIASLGWVSVRLGATPRSVGWFWVGWFVVCQLPSANFLRQETLFDERYVMTAGVGVAGLLAGLLTALFRNDRWKVVARVATVTWILVLAIVSYGRSTTYATSLQFHGQWALTNPVSPNAQNGLGVALARAGREDEAIESYEKALRLNPDHAQARNNLAVAMQQRGDPAAAVDHLNEAIRVRPGFAEAHFNLANSLVELGRPESAETHFREALGLRPGYARAHNNYAALLIRLGRIDDALRELEAVMRLDPGHARSRHNYGIVLARQGRFDQAIPYYLESLRIAPGSAAAQFDLAVALESLGRHDEAVDRYRKALASARASGDTRLMPRIEQGLRRLEP